MHLCHTPARGPRTECMAKAEALQCRMQKWPRRRRRRRRRLPLRCGRTRQWRAL